MNLFSFVYFPNKFSFEIDFTSISIRFFTTLWTDSLNILHQMCWICLSDPFEGNEKIKKFVHPQFSWIHMNIDIKSTCRRTYICGTWWWYYYFWLRKYTFFFILIFSFIPSPYGKLKMKKNKKKNEIKIQEYSIVLYFHMSIWYVYLRCV